MISVVDKFTTQVMVVLTTPGKQVMEVSSKQNQFRIVGKTQPTLDLHCGLVDFLKVFNPMGFVVMLPVGVEGLDDFLTNSIDVHCSVPLNASNAGLEPARLYQFKTLFTFRSPYVVFHFIAFQTGPLFIFLFP